MKNSEQVSLQIKYDKFNQFSFKVKLKTLKAPHEFLISINQIHKNKSEGEFVVANH